MGLKYRHILIITLSIPTLLFVGYYFGFSKASSRPPQIKTVEKTVRICEEPEVAADYTWALIQDWRISNNLKPYTKDDLLCNIADERLSQIQDDFSHDKFTEGINKHSYVWDGNYLGENLARDFRNPREMVSAWLDSPTHLKLLTYPDRFSCIRCSSSGYCVQIFGGK